MDITQKVAEKIRNEHVKPISKQYFVVRHVLVWTALAGTVTLTGVACGVVVYLLQSHEWGMRSLAGQSFSQHMIVSLPYFWLALAVALLVAAMVNTKWLPRGYTVRPIVCIGVYGTLALLVGVVIAETGRAEYFDRMAVNYIPAYEAMVARPQEDWNRPDIGLLAGTLQVSQNGGFTLVDRRGAHWVINAENIDWRCGAVKRMGDFVKLIGTMSSQSEFYAQSALPWDVTLAGSTHCIRNRALIPCE